MPEPPKLTERQRQLSVLFPAQDYAEIERQAAMRKITLADYARHKLLGKPLPPVVSDEDDE